MRAVQLWGETVHIYWGGRSETADKLEHRGRRGVKLMGAVAAAVALIVGALTVPVAAVADTTPAAGTPETFAADALPTVQIDGVVYAQEVVGN
ncbi:hypothetical protein, partial [Microbacterium sp.]|uniref:hypothetical protein n=1 Tax=Microbacterium sp. TaxID=51671 RepID=UPI002FE36136